MSKGTGGCSRGRRKGHPNVVPSRLRGAGVCPGLDSWPLPLGHGDSAVLGDAAT